MPYVFNNCYYHGNVTNNFSMTLAPRKSLGRCPGSHCGAFSFALLLLIAILCISAQADSSHRDMQDIGCPSSSSSGQSCPAPGVNSQAAGSNSSPFTFTISPSVFDVDLRPCSACVAAAPSFVHHSFRNTLLQLCRMAFQVGNTSDNVMEQHS